MNKTAKLDQLAYLVISYTLTFTTTKKLPIAECHTEKRPMNAQLRTVCQNFDLANLHESLDEKRVRYGGRSVPRPSLPSLP